MATEIKSNDDEVIEEQQKAIKFLSPPKKEDKDNSDFIDKKNKSIYKSFITIIFSALCLVISLGINEMFKLILNNPTKGQTINTREILYYFIYIFVTITLTLSLAYFSNVEIV